MRLSERRRSQMIAALLTTRTKPEAAAVAGVSLATLERAMREPEFVAAYEAETRRLLRFSTGRVRSVVSKALDALERNLEAEAPPAQQVSAARTVLEHQRQGDLADLAERIEALEAKGEMPT